MSYENSAAAKFVATHCGICGRPLVDAESVSAGIGPICADKYGLDRSPSGISDFESSVASISSCKFQPIDNYFIGISEQNARKAANALVYTISAIAGQLEFTDVSMNPDLRFMADAVHHLGYVELASIIKERLDNWVEKLSKKVKIKIVKVEDNYEVSSPYSKRFLDAVHSNCPGNVWSANRKIRKISVHQKDALIKSLVYAYPFELMIFDGVLDRVPLKVIEPVKQNFNEPQNTISGYEEF